MTRKVLLLVAILVVSIFALSGICHADKPSVMESKKKVVWKLAHSAYEGDIIDIYAIKAKEEIEKAFEGKVEIQLFPAGQLGDYVAQQEQLQSGGLEFSLPVVASLSTILPEINFTGINFVLSPSHAVNDKAMREGEAFKIINEKLEAQGIKVINWISEDFSCWSSNTPIEKLEDLVGLKIRVYPAAQIIANYKALNANPTPIPFAEIYSALQLNVATAQENPLAIIYSNKLFEVQKYITISNHTAPIDAFSASKSFWDTLSREDKDRIEKAMDVVSKYTLEKQVEVRNDAIGKIKAAGSTTFIELDPAERERIAEASIPARQEFFKATGEEGEKLLSLWLEDVKKYEAELSE